MSLSCLSLFSFQVEKLPCLISILVLFIAIIWFTTLSKKFHDGSYNNIFEDVSFDIDTDWRNFNLLSGGEQIKILLISLFLIMIP